MPRITGLIIGVDAGVGRNTYLTDTMIVVSLDPVDEHRLDGLDPARHGRRPAGGRAQVPRQDQLARVVRAPPPEAVPGLRRDRLRRADGRARHPARTQRSSTTRRSTSAASSGSWTRSAGSTSTSRAPSATRTTTSTATRTGSRSRPAATTSTAARPSPTRASARPPARATSPAPHASRRSSPASATPSSRAASSTTRSGCSRRSARPSRRTSRASVLPGPGRGCQPGRPRADVSGGHHPSAGPDRVRRARLHPDPRRQGDPGAGGEALPDRRHAARRTSTWRPSVDGLGRGQRRRQLRAGAPTPQADPEAHAEADPEADARRPRRDADPDADPRVTPEPTPEADAGATPTRLTGTFGGGDRSGRRWQHGGMTASKCADAHPRTRPPLPTIAALRAAPGRRPGDRPRGDRRVGRPVPAVLQGRRHPDQEPALRRLEPHPARHDVPPVEPYEPARPALDVTTPG